MDAATYMEDLISSEFLPVAFFTTFSSEEELRTTFIGRVSISSECFRISTNKSSDKGVQGSVDQCARCFALVKRALKWTADFVKHPTHRPNEKNTEDTDGLSIITLLQLMTRSRKKKFQTPTLALKWNQLFSIPSHSMLAEMEKFTTPARDPQGGAPVLHIIHAVPSRYYPSETSTSMIHHGTNPTPSRDPQGDAPATSGIPIVHLVPPGYCRRGNNHPRNGLLVLPKGQQSFTQYHPGTTLRKPQFPTTILSNPSCHQSRPQQGPARRCPCWQ